jgi:branched-chain amino acid transport system permease protein
VLDVDLRQPDEEPCVLPPPPELEAGMSAVAPSGVAVRGRRRGAPSQRTVIAAGFGVAAVLPLVLGEGSGALPYMVLAAAYVVMALGLNIVVGYAGLLDLGYVAFFAIGAHVAAYFGSAFWAGAGGGDGLHLLVGAPTAGLPGIHVNFLIILVLAIAATTTAGVLIGVPTLRLRGDYVALVTLAFGEIIGQLSANGDDLHLFGGSLTAGPNGISPIDGIDLPVVGRFGLDPRPWYWFALALAGLMLFVTFRLRDSRVGRAWIALRDDEQAAAFAGVPIARTKLRAYGVGAAAGGVSGAFLASYLTVVNPQQFTFSFSIFILAMVVIGGLGSIAGVVIGAIVLTVVNYWLLPNVLHDLPGHMGLDVDLSQVSSGVYGLLLVLVMLLRPQGLCPVRRGSSIPFDR